MAEFDSLHLKQIRQSEPPRRWGSVVCACVCVSPTLGQFALTKEWGRSRGPYKRSGAAPTARRTATTHHCSTWIRSLNSCSPPWSSPSWWLAVRRRRGTSRWPVRATTLWAGRPACCPVSGGHRTPEEPSRRSQTAERRRATACCPR